MILKSLLGIHCLSELRTSPLLKYWEWSPGFISQYHCCIVQLVFTLLQICILYNDLQNAISAQVCNIFQIWLLNLAHCGWEVIAFMWDSHCWKISLQLMSYRCNSKAVLKHPREYWFFICLSVCLRIEAQI